MSLLWLESFCKVILFSKKKAEEMDEDEDEEEDNQRRTEDLKRNTAFNTKVEIDIDSRSEKSEESEHS